MGIELPLTEFTIGSLTVYPYGCFLALAVLLSTVCAVFTFRKARLSRSILIWFLLFALPLGLLCSRLSCCLCSMDQTLQYIEEDGFGYLFAFNRGGLMIFGAMLGCFAALLITARITGCDKASLADALACPVMLMIALRKLCDIVTGGGYGWPVGEWFSGEGMSLFTIEDPALFNRFPFALPDMYDGGRWAVCILEALIALALLFVLTRRRDTAAGGKAVLMLILYTSAQLLCESLRQDSVIRWGFVRANQIIGAVLLIALLAVCLSCLSPDKRHALTLPCVLMLLGGFVIIMAMEFALEGKISLIEGLPMDVCYLIMLIGAALTMNACLKAWKPAFTEN